MVITERCTNPDAPPERRRVGRVEASSNCDVEVIKLKAGMLGQVRSTLSSCIQSSTSALEWCHLRATDVLDCLVISWKVAVQQYGRAGGLADRRSSKGQWIKLGLGRANAASRLNNAGMLGPRSHSTSVSLCSAYQSASASHRHVLACVCWPGTGSLSPRTWFVSEKVPR